MAIWHPSLNLLIASLYKTCLLSWLNCQKKTYNILLEESTSPLGVFLRIIFLLLVLYLVVPLGGGGLGSDCRKFGKLRRQKFTAMI
jgi:hypothetical protein